MRTMLLTLTLLAVAIGGCSAAQSSSQTDATSTVRKLMLDPADVRRLDYNISWATGVAPAPGEHITHAAWLDNQLILVQEPNNIVVAYAVRDGHRVWQRFVGRKSSDLFMPHLVEDTIYINNETSMFELRAEDGLVTRENELNAVVVSTFAYTNNLAVFGSTTGRVFAHSLRRGYADWQAEMPAGIVVPPINLSGGIFVADSAGNYARFNSLSGRLVWKGKAFEAIEAVPVASTSTVFLASRDHKVYAVSSETGLDRWTHLLGGPLRKPPVLVRDTLFVRTPGGSVIAFDEQTGAVLYELPFDAIALLQTDLGVFFRTDDKLVVVDPEDGHVAVEAAVDNLQDVVVGPDNAMILIGRDGRILRMDPRRK